MKNKSILQSLRFLTLLGLMVLGIGNAWGDTTYTITFKTNTSDGSTEIGTSTKTSTVISSGTDYVSGFTSSCSKAYYSSISGVKLGTKSASGTLEFNIASLYQSNIQKITIKSAKYGSDTGTLSLYNGSTSLKSGITPGTDYTHTFDTPTTVSSIKITTSTKRAYVSEIILETESEDTRTAVNISTFTTNGGVTSIVKGNTLSTSVTNDQSGWTPAYTYESSNPNVATVATDGTITAVAKGTAKITASLNVDKDDENYKAGTTTSKSVDITVTNPTHKVYFSANGTILNEGGTDVVEGETITFPTENPADVNNKKFTGWYGSTYSHATVAPTYVTSATMGENDVTYFAVYATASSGTDSWSQVTTLANITEGTYVIKNGSYVLSNEVASSSGPAALTAPTVASSKITGTVEDNMKWIFTSTGTANQFYVKNPDGKYLYETSNNNGLRVNTTSDKWTFAVNTTGYFSMKGANNSRYCAQYSGGSDWRSYTSATATNYTNSGKLELYKLTAGITYTDFCTSVLPTAAAPTMTETCKFASSMLVTITNKEDGATIYYTTNGDDPTTGSSSFTGLSQQVEISSNIAQDITVKAIAVKNEMNNSSITSTSYTALNTYSSISDAFSAAGEEATEVGFIFNGEIVTGKSTSNAYLKDTSGNVAVIYASGHGFAQDDVLSGTVITKIQKYNGILEFTELTSTTSGLTKTTGTPATPESKALSEITASDYGKLVTISGLTWYESESVMKSGENSISLTSSLYSSAQTDLVNMAVYTITGIVTLKNSALALSPRGSSDIDKTADPQKTTPTTSWKLNEEDITTPVHGEIGSSFTSPTISSTSDGNVTYSSSNENVATIDADGKVTLISMGETTITANTAETDNFFASSANYTLQVTEVSELPFTFDDGKEALKTKKGYFASELGSDYTNSPKLKFDAQNDYLIIKYNGDADKIRYTVKGVKTKDEWNAQFDVMESADGNEYTSVYSHTTMSTDVNEVITTNLKETSRFVKFVYTSRTNGNVALGNIAIQHSSQLSSPTNLSATDVTKNSATLTWDAVENASGYKVTIGDNEYDAQNNSYSATGLAASTSYSWSVKAQGDGFNYVASNAASGEAFTTLGLTLLTVNFVNRGQETSIAETEENGGVTPPATSKVGDYEFAGWSETNLGEETEEKPTFVVLTDGKYYPSAATTLYAIYTTKKEGKQYGFTLSLVDDSTTYYIGARSSGNSYFTGTTSSDNALVIYEDNGYLYYMNGTTPTYFSGETTGKADITYNTEKSKPWTIASTANGITYKSGVTGRYLACNPSASHRFATYGTTYPYEFTKTTSSTYITAQKNMYSASPSSIATPTTSFTTSKVSVDALDGNGNKNTYMQAVTTNSTGSITYSSSDESIATVASDGTVSVVKGGTVTITANVDAVAETWSASSATYELTINKMTPRLEFEKDSPTSVYVANTITVTATTNSDATVYYADNSDKLDIDDETGVITGIAVTNGVNVYAYVDETDVYSAQNTTSTGAKLSIQVLSNAKTQTLSFENSLYNFAYGAEVEKFTNTLSGAVTKVTYQSSNTAVAVVDESGEVTVNSSTGGTATITAIAEANDSVVEDGIRYNYSEASKSYTITVIHPQPTLSLAAGEYHSNQLLELSGDDVETFYYTTDGADVTFDPENVTSNGTEYKDAISLVKGNTTIKAIAIYIEGENYIAGAQTTATYNLVAPSVPTFSFDDKATITAGESIEISCVEGASISYLIVDEKADTIAQGTDLISPVSVEMTKAGQYTVEATAKWNVEGGFTSTATEKTLYVFGPADVPYYCNEGGSTLPQCFKKQGVGTYPNADKTKIKFDDSSDEVILWYNGVASKVIFNAKMNGDWDDSNKFVVSTSSDGKNWKPLNTFTGSENKLGTEQTYGYDLPESARYVKWYYETKIKGNVGVGNIQLQVSQSITIKAAAGWATVCLPFNATIGDYSGDVAPVAKYVTVDEDKLVKTDITNIKAQEGFLLKGVEGEDVTVTFVSTIEDVDDATGNQMVGTTKEGGDIFSGDGTYYILTKGFPEGKTDAVLGFFWDPKTKDEGASANCAQYKAVLRIPSSSIKGFSLDDETPTCISDVDANVGADNIYNLSGQKLNKLQKGINIVNGRKILF